jgi:ribosomal protein S27AE
MNKAEYKQYLKSDHWQNLRGRKMKRRQRCGVCASTEDIQVHHLRYRNIYDVETPDLRKLCGRCHIETHKLLKSGALRLTSHSHHGLWNQTKHAVKMSLGLGARNMFCPTQTLPGE